MLHIELAHSEFFSHFVPFGPGQTRHIALNRAIQTVTGDKGPNTHWVHSENIESTVNM